jgi:hypothetical protein
MKQTQCTSTFTLHNETQLASVCLAILNNNPNFSQSNLSTTEIIYIANLNQTEVDPALLEYIYEESNNGIDVLGFFFSNVRSPLERREQGAIYTPQSIIDSLFDLIKDYETIVRIIDPGAGSGRFIIKAAELFPDAELIAIELDPLAALMLRANIFLHNIEARTTIYVEDYRNIYLPECKGKSAFVGNPPYLRHHSISAEWKEWFTSQFARMHIKSSALAGLHVHFFLKTFLLANPGDIGVFITSSEWLDVNYGSALKELLVSHLGCVSLRIISPQIEIFPGTATTAVITNFEVGETTKPIQFQRIDNLEQINSDAKKLYSNRQCILPGEKWSKLAANNIEIDYDTIELGELFEVHRGQVTGSNTIWIAGEHSDCIPEYLLIPAVTKARELIVAGATLQSTDGLRRIIDIPADLDTLDYQERKLVELFLEWAKSVGADTSYTARHRKSWWAVGLKKPAPILCTYMARRNPQFTLNACLAKHINVVHGLYPKTILPDMTLDKIVSWLNANIKVADGRTYAGGLTKFEPKEIERLRIPFYIGS